MGSKWIKIICVVCGLWGLNLFADDEVLGIPLELLQTISDNDAQFVRCLIDTYLEGKTFISREDISRTIEMYISNGKECLAKGAPYIVIHQDSSVKSSETPSNASRIPDFPEINVQLPDISATIEMDIKSRLDAVDGQIAAQQNAIAGALTSSVDYSGGQLHQANSGWMASEGQLQGQMDSAMAAAQTAMQAVFAAAEAGQENIEAKIAAEKAAVVAVMAASANYELKSRVDYTTAMSALWAQLDALQQQMDKVDNDIRNISTDVPMYQAKAEDASTLSTQAGHYDGSTSSLLKSLPQDQVCKIENKSELSDGAPWTFKTPRDSPQGQKLQEISDYRAYVLQKISAENIEYQAQRKQMVNFADQSILLADGYYADAQLDHGDVALETAKIMLDVALSLTPGVSWCKDVYEAFSGKSLVTGEDLDSLARSFAIMGAVSGGLLSKFGELRVVATVIEKVGGVMRASESFQKGLGLVEKLLGVGIKRVEELKEFTGTIAKAFKGKGAALEAEKVVEETEKVIASSGEVIEKIGAKKFDEILSLPKGSRPAPETYLPKEYIESHLAKFDEGASRFMSKADLNRYGPEQIDGTTFVLTKSEADQILLATGGKRGALEDALGFPKGYLDNVEMVRVDVSKPRDFNLRIPSGNEAGAFDGYWLPGGKLPSGYREAVLDLGNAPHGSWTSTSLMLN